jgi:hypothetical protein
MRFSTAVVSIPDLQRLGELWILMNLMFSAPSFDDEASLYLVTAFVLEVFRW